MTGVARWCINIVSEATRVSLCENTKLSNLSHELDVIVVSVFFFLLRGVVRWCINVVPEATRVSL
jgi:hypothetical protein